MNKNHTEINLAQELLDSIDAGGIDLADAVLAACRADGITAQWPAHVVALAYEIRRRAGRDALAEVGVI